MATPEVHQRGGEAHSGQLKQQMCRDIVNIKQYEESRLSVLNDNPELHIFIHF